MIRDGRHDNAPPRPRHEPPDEPHSPRRGLQGPSDHREHQEQPVYCQSLMGPSRSKARHRTLLLLLSASTPSALTIYARLGIPEAEQVRKRINDLDAITYGSESTGALAISKPDHGR
jgi:hypothetical protein